MDDFDDRLGQLLKARPGLTKQRLSTELGVEYSDEFRKQLDVACDKGIAHKIQDKYYPGTLSGY